MSKTVLLPAKPPAKPGENHLQNRKQNQVKTGEKPGECNTPHTPQGFRLRYGLRLRLNTAPSYWPGTDKDAASKLGSRSSGDTFRPVNVFAAVAASGVPPIRSPEWPNRICIFFTPEPAHR